MVAESDASTHRFDVERILYPTGMSTKQMIDSVVGTH